MAIRIPARYIRIQRVGRTKSLRSKKTGQMRGRTRVEGYGDKTYVRRVTKSVDLDKDGDYDIFGGTIMGRSKAPKVKSRKRRASLTSRGYYVRE